MRRRAVLASTGALLAGCLGRAGSPEDATPSDDDAGRATSTGGGTPHAPLVHWTFELDPERDSVTVTHATGERLTAERTERVELVLTTGPDHPIPTDATLTPTRTPQVTRRTWREAGGGYPISPGDAVRFEGATPGDTLEVWWYGTERHRAGTRLVSVTFEPVPG